MVWIIGLPRFMSLTYVGASKESSGLCAFLLEQMKPTSLDPSSYILKYFGKLASFSCVFTLFYKFPRMIPKIEMEPDLGFWIGVLVWFIYEYTCSNNWFLVLFNVDHNVPTFEVLGSKQDVSTMGSKIRSIPSQCLYSNNVHSIRNVSMNAHPIHDQIIVGFARLANMRFEP